MITLTDKAIAKLKEFSEAEGIGHLCVRIKVLGGGCAGMTQDMYFDDFVGEMDEVMELGDVKIIVDQVSLQYLENATIDYVDSPFSSGFKFLNPDVKTTCGCGSSFSV